MTTASLSRPHADPPPVRGAGIRPHPPRAQARVHLAPAGDLPDYGGDDRANPPRTAAASE
jgi:hypothetical protein